MNFRDHFAGHERQRAPGPFRGKRGIHLGSAPAEVRACMHCWLLTWYAKDPQTLSLPVSISLNHPS